MKTTKKPSVKQQVIAAYNEATRNLNFKASSAVSINDAVKIMSLALECDEDCEGYNFFKSNLFRHLPKGTKITLAREGSVCAYIIPPKGITLQEHDYAPLMLFDEWSVEANGTIRIWWD